MEKLTYNLLQQKADELKNSKLQFYTYVMCYCMQYALELGASEVSEEEFDELVGIMNDYLEGCSQVSPWTCGDAIAMCIAEYGVRDTIDNYNCEGKYSDRDYCTDSFIVEKICEF